jgi:bacterioferritin (cytochrome b1)
MIKAYTDAISALTKENKRLQSVVKSYTDASRDDSVSVELFGKDLVDKDIKIHELTRQLKMVQIL